MTYNSFCLIYAVCFVINFGWGQGEKERKEFKLKSQVQPNEIFALNHTHVRVMKSHSSVAR